MSNNEFISRHNGPRDYEINLMLNKIGVLSMDELIDKTIPQNIRLQHPLELPSPLSEYEYLKELRKIAQKNKIYRTYIGQGYYNTITPSVIKRNILENPSWYTSYTPYQAEISQGRLEGLLNFQTMVTELTGMQIANASLLDESTAAAEAMIMLYNTRSKTAIKNGAVRFAVDKNVFPQTVSVLKARAAALDIDLFITDTGSLKIEENIFGILFQYPDSNGEVKNYRELTGKLHQLDINVVVIADLLSLAIFTPPGEWGADVVVGTTQRFGVPMGFGGPHAAYFATNESFKRYIPGRIIGVTVDSRGKRAYRMALQTREQHIKREKATSNICTAQALLANMAAMYAAYHGPEGLRKIALNIHSLTGILATMLEELGFKPLNSNFFDTLNIVLPAKINTKQIENIALRHEINFHYKNDREIGISIDETTTGADINEIASIFAEALNRNITYLPKKKPSLLSDIDSSLIRTSVYMKAEVFNRYHSETEMMRYIKKLERKDFSLTHSMISLGSCTMKLNAATEMFALSWPEFSDIHPYVPHNQALGYYQLINELEDYLTEITGFDSVSFQPNSGAAGEYTGLLIIKAYHKHNKQDDRNVILIPSSAHGTNPASATMAGMVIEVINCDENGNIMINHLKELAEKNKSVLAGMMVTYPSTHGVFETQIKELIDIVHYYGGLVYMDGANMNAQVGLTNPSTIGADICHLNLHKTFAIPHGGGGPGMGPVAVAKHLVDFLPSHPIINTGGKLAIDPVSSAPFGSGSILTISHAYCKMLGSEGLTLATKIAVLNANYLAARLKDYFKVLYTGSNGFVAHEMILDCRPLKQLAEITESDIAKRLMDYGFHSPTLSFPVHGTLMIEPTESESMQELDRFADSLISIYNEIIEISQGKADKTDNLLKNAPHCQEVMVDDTWEHPYARNRAAFPFDWVRENKLWPAVSRIDDAYGDRNLICTCN